MISFVATNILLEGKVEPVSSDFWSFGTAFTSLPPALLVEADGAVALVRCSFELSLTALTAAL